MATAATKSYTPVWIASNRYGVISDKQYDASTGLHVKNSNVLMRFEDYDQDDAPISEYKVVELSYGADFYNNSHFKNQIFEQAYAKVDYQHWSLKYGRFEEIIGEVDHELSSGSLGTSGNAIPIPKIEISLTEYSAIPFTNGLFQIKGSFAHGWFGNNRYMKDAFYHQKTLYVRIGKGKFKLYGGIQHYAEWGGHRSNLHTDRSLKGFWNVVLVKAADDGSVGTATNGIQPSRPGDQRGCLEAGFDLETTGATFHGYGQMPFESGEEIDPRNRSFLLGLSIAPHESGLKKLDIEFLYTKDMNAFVGVRQRNSYYNNGEYKTGWDYDNRVIGTPLFMDRTVASHYFDDIQPFNWNAADKSIPGNANIVNNRLSAIHIGAIFTVGDQFETKTKLTYTRNYGTYNLSEFSKGKNQFYTLQELQYSPSKELFKVKAGIGFDFGELGTNIGIFLGGSYQIF